MERVELEQEVFKRLRIGKPGDIDIVRRSVEMKTTKELEDILERMKAEGR